MAGGAAVRQPRSAAIAGLAFGLILTRVLVLLHSAAPGSVAEFGSFGARMAAVFTLAVSTARFRVGSLPRWLVLAGHLTGALLLLTPPLPRWAQLLFPLWVISISIQVLVREHADQRQPAASPSTLQCGVLISVG